MADGACHERRWSLGVTRASGRPKIQTLPDQRTVAFQKLVVFCEVQ